MNIECKDIVFDFKKTKLKDLVTLNKRYGWSLNKYELEIILSYFRKISRNPTRAEIETIAQTWSEHCKHKTFNSPCRITIKDKNGRIKRIYEFKNLFKETIVYATEKLKRDYCLSVFKDNAGIIELSEDSNWGICFKVETHNHPCAIEPYGGAETGVGGVVRDILGVGLGAKPVLNTDVFCFAFPDKKYKIAKGFLSPHKIICGVVSGVRDYGNKIGIPTACGSVFFDDRYLYNPLVYVGCAGIIPRDKIEKKAIPGSYIVVIGGATGRDGIGGSTFSSRDIDANTSTSHVQIGHAINEKKIIDVIMKARDRGIYSAISDCGAGGFSSAVGELASECGARVELDNVILKEKDMEGWEIWLSESQERMVLCVYEDKLKELKKICEIEECQYYVIGRFTDTRMLEVYYKDEKIIDLDMDFLHHRLPRIKKEGIWIETEDRDVIKPLNHSDFYERFKNVVSDLNCSSRRWIVEQYDHEVIGQSVLKPFCGDSEKAPSDAAVIWTAQLTGEFESFKGFAVSCGMRPAASDLSPYDMALYSIDEAVRNLVCVGADITRGALLDNFSAANPDDKNVMGGFALAALGARDGAIDIQMPYISGKDSFYNQTKIDRKLYQIPTTLLISAVAPVDDVRKVVSSYFKKASNPVYVVGEFKKGLGASVYGRIFEPNNNLVPPIDLKKNKKIYIKLIEAMKKGFVLASHDVSDGGLAVCISEMSFCEIGAEIDINKIIKKYGVCDVEVLFGENGSRIVVEVEKDYEEEFLKMMRGFDVVKIGKTIPYSVVFRNNGCLIMNFDPAFVRSLWERKAL
ncbi:MAG: phosphoribosylformylglycinamidine synthase subunit PurL [Elusimicrobiales bacterium]